MKSEKTATFVLIHGAWHGGWCWKKVRPLLQSAGHAVHTPTLTGLGERAHLSRPEVDLDTHIEDVIKVLDFDEGVNVTLGLPIVRTSPDHGTAFGIAGTGTARPGATIAAIRMAGECAARRAAVK